MTILLGDCRAVMASLPEASADFALTDPPYIVRYRDRQDRVVFNDDNAAWLHPAFAALHRVLKKDALCVSFYGWNKIDIFMRAWKHAGFQPVGHLVFRKGYASGEKYLAYHHEQAFLLAKGRPRLPRTPMPDVRDDWRYTGNKLHPTQKPVRALQSVIENLTRPGETVIDPFCGSGSTLAAAKNCGRRYIGIDIDPVHHATAVRRLQ